MKQAQGAHRVILTRVAFGAMQHRAELGHSPTGRAPRGRVVRLMRLMGPAIGDRRRSRGMRPSASSRYACRVRSASPGRSTRCRSRSIRRRLRTRPCRPTAACSLALRRSSSFFPWDKRHRRRGAATWRRAPTSTQLPRHGTPSQTGSLCRGRNTSPRCGWSFSRQTPRRTASGIHTPDTTSLSGPERCASPKNDPGLGARAFPSQRGGRVFAHVYAPRE
jgi:hypothetical protein